MRLRGTVWVWVAAFACGGCGGGSGGGAGGGEDVMEGASEFFSDNGGGEVSGGEKGLMDDALLALEEGGDIGALDLRPDVDWDVLPRLPPGKAFSTRYAAGAASRDVTPAWPVFMGGFGFCGGAEELCRKSEGVHDPLLAKVVVLADTETGEVVAFAGVDSVGIFLWDQRLMQEAVQWRMYEEHGVYFDGKRLLVGASHDHAAPDTAGLWGPMFGVPRDEEYIKFLRDQIVEATVEAFGALDDVELTWWKGSSPNDTAGTAPKVLDQDLFVLRGVRPDGGPVFTLTRWSSHPTAYGSKNNGLSADWVGPFRLRMEAEFGGIAVFMNGNVGGTYPERPVECGLSEEAYPQGWKDPDLKPEDFMKVTCTGDLVAKNAVEAAEGAKSLADSGIEFHHKVFGFYPENATLLLAAKIAQVPFAWGDPDELLSDNPPDMITEFSLVRVGDLTFLTAPGESFPALGRQAAQMLEARGYPNPVVLGLTQDWLGYLLTEEQWKDQELSYHQGLSPGRKFAPAYLKALGEVLGIQD